MFAASAFASRLILSISAEFPRFASSILFSFLVRALTSSKFSIGPPNGSRSHPMRSLLQLNRVTSAPDDSAAFDTDCAFETVVTNASKRARLKYFIVATPQGVYGEGCNHTIATSNKEAGPREKSSGPATLIATVIRRHTGCRRRYDGYHRRYPTASGSQEK